MASASKNGFLHLLLPGDMFLCMFMGATNLERERLLEGSMVKNGLDQTLEIKGLAASHR